MTISPYLAFPGTAREAFTRYKEILGGELVLLGFDDGPPESAPSGAKPDGIMHAALVVGTETLMGADDPSGNFDGTVRGMCVSYMLDDPQEAKRVFEALSERGNVQMPLGETFFSPAFGMCIDRFGTPWMIMTNPPQT